ncbi:hypothetical protein F751_3122 [Auxenochlorella protothecoides]|uniref:TTI1 N-terminal TPR domain-containing protein n=1 Tax=Auxenochlorella protothecoides TaxID=3075 RepID=A0A087SFA0_AUXPR|nr:hypothetical protein F751_3122 [Auxenochlorella protothecoides]KFM24404.1 hypothetical protein F751_3122 [Auxenochlorella protothecoides]
MPQPLPTPGDDAPSSTSEAVEALARALESMSGEWDEPEWRGGSLGDLGAGQALHGDWDAAEAEDEGNGNVATGPAWLPSSLGNAQGLNFTALLTGLDDDPLAALTAAVEEDRPRFAPSAEWQAAMGASQADEDAGELVTTDAASGGPPSPRGGAASLRAGAGTEDAASPASSNRAGASSGQGATAASEDSEDTSIPCAGEGGSSDEAEVTDHNPGSGQPGPADQPSAAFQRLRPLCTALLGAGSNPQALAGHLQDLHAVLESLGDAELGPCVAYVLFPLLILLDAAAQEGGAGAAPRGQGSWRATERCLACVLSALRGAAGSAQTPGAVLPRLAAVLGLPEVTEEASRLACEAILLSLRDQTSGPASVLASREAAPLTGHLFSSLLHVVAAQMRAGSGGSRALVALALQALGCGIRRVADADVLAFFLPGIASGLANALSGGRSSNPSSAGPGSRANMAALDALTRLVCATLGDGEGAVSGTVGDKRTGAAPPTAASALKQLRALAAGAQGWPCLPDAEPGSDAEGALDPPPGSPASPAQLDPEDPILWVERTAAWRADAAGKLGGLLATTLPRLAAAQQSPATRAAVARAAANLLKCCSSTLGAATADLLLGVLGVAAQDAWPEVAAPARAALQAWAGQCIASHGLGPDPLLAKVLDLLRGLPEAFHRGSHPGTQACLLLTSCLQVAPEGWMERCLLSRPDHLAAVHAALHGVLEVDAQVAELSEVPEPREARTAPGEVGEAPEYPSPHAGSSPHHDAGVSVRMAPALVHVTTEAAWRAVASLCGALGSAAGRSRAGLERLLEPCLESAGRRAGADATESCRALTLAAAFLAGTAPQPGEEGAARHEALALAAVLVLADSAPWEAGGSLGEALPRGAGVAALRLCSAWDLVAVLAAVQGPRFARRGAALRPILLPLFESLESPSGLVAEAAGLALSALVRHGRYDAAGPGDLVSQNADYIVDGLCRQLRQPARHPRAPALFAALLKQTGVPQMLLPLLAEPLRVALQGLSVMLRAAAPQHTLSFLSTLREALRGAASLAREARTGAEALAAEVAEAWEAARSDAAREEEAEDGEEGSGYEAARAYFTRRAEEHAGVDGHPAAPEPLQVPLSERQLAALRALRGQAHAAASLAAPASDAAGVLAASASLAVATAALSTCLAALAALAEAGAALAALEVVLALDDWRVPVVEAALDSLAALLKLGGSFLLRRFGKEAAPRLRRLLADGAAFMGLAALDKPAATRLLQAALSRPDDPAVDAPPGLLACRPAKLEAMLRAVERQGLEEPAAA